MASGAEVGESRKVSASLLDAGKLIEQSLAKLPVSTLTQLCQHLKAQLIKQRLPLICSACRPSILQVFNMELNLTRMIRGLCKSCRRLFSSNLTLGGKVPSSSPLLDPHHIITPIPIPTPTPSPPPTIVAPIPHAKVPKVVLKLSPPSISAPSPPPCPTLKEALYDLLIRMNISWCRYCGCTGGTAWQAGPWGPRTLCKKHSMAYRKGISREGRPEQAPLDLSQYEGETFSQRRRPIVQESCVRCSKKFNQQDNYECCDGCPFAFHRHCLEDDTFNKIRSCREGGEALWFCAEKCKQDYSRHLAAASSSLQSMGRYAKRIVSPPTPPPTPISSSSSVSLCRKRRATSEGSADIMVCFESDVTIKRPSLSKETVLTPSYSFVAYPPPRHTTIAVPARPIEPLDDVASLARHARYETVEKDVRLLRPAILKHLYEGNNADGNPI